MPNRPTYLAVLVATVVTLAAERNATAEQCAPSARLVGDPELVASVSKRLEERGVRLTSDEECGVVVAVLAWDGEKVAVAIIDGTVRDRQAFDEESATTVIEQFVRRDLAAPLLAVRGQRPPPEHAKDGEQPELAAAATVSAPVRRLELAAAGTFGVGDDSSLWAGAQVSGCINLGPLCSGVLIRYGKDVEVRGDAKDIDSSRSSLDMALLSRVPLGSERWRFEPGVAVGVTSVRASQVTGDPEEANDEALDFFFGVQANARYQLPSNWSVGLFAEFGYAPLASDTLGELPDDDSDPPALAGTPKLKGWFGLRFGFGGL